MHMIHRTDGMKVFTNLGGNLIAQLWETADTIFGPFFNMANPCKFVDKCIFQFFNKLYEQRTPISTVPRMEFMMVLPFLGTTSVKVKNNLVRSFRQIIPFSKLEIVFKTSKRLSACFTFKDKFPKSLMSGVIYKSTCAERNLSYIGCTKKFWEKHLEEH